MRRLFKLRRFWFVLLCVPAALLTELAEKNPEVTERVYSTGVYRWLSGFFGRVSGFFPFSLAQWVLVGLAVFYIAYIAASLYKIAKRPLSRPDATAKLAGTLLCSAGIIWFGFVVLCGLNYHRLSFAEMYGLDVHPSPAGELAELCGELAEAVNTYAEKVERDKNGTMKLSADSYYQTAKQAAQTYETIGAWHPKLAGFTPVAKPVLGSRLMSLADLVGVYFPFTFEANVNIDIPDYKIPASMLHELAHFKGFMREDEANFISYLAGISSGNDDFAYSSSMLAFVYSSNALYSADHEAYWNVYDALCEYAKTDFRANSEYWKQFEGPIAEVSEKVNDVYLKTNSQTSGVKSYGEMVDLLLAYRRAYG